MDQNRPSQEIDRTAAATRAALIEPGFARSRRRALWMVAGAILGLLSARHRDSVLARGGPRRRAGGQRCRKRGAGHSRRCRTRRDKQRNERLGAGPFAANCPPVNTCALTDHTPFCNVGHTPGACTVTSSGDAFCASDMQCSLGFRICDSDADCQEILGPNGKCLICPDTGCANAMCAKYAGDE